MKPIMNLFVCAIISMLAGCRSNSTGHLPAVANFDAAKYAGVWYEIARKDHKFEQDLTNVQASYICRADGKIEVKNRGIKLLNGTSKSLDISGSASIVENSGGLLMVTFFWPFSSEYKILKLDENYQYALVTGGTYDYLWLLARTPVIPAEAAESYLRFARSSGFDLGNLIMVDQRDNAEIYEGIYGKEVPGNAGSNQ